MPAPDPRLLATAIEAVLRAGALQIERLRAGVRVEKKGAIDLVTEVDLEVERMFRALIEERFPDHDVLAEELGGGSRGASHRWVFDPLDGTTNYAHGLPIFCASLALEIDGVPEIGAVYDPNRRELFTAERGVGAWLNGAPLRVSGATSLGDSMLVTGFPYTVHEPASLERVVGLFRDFVGRARAVRRLGSAAIDLCWVAAGRMDGFWEERLHPWDTMAGALLVQEAGGRVTAMDGGPWVPANGQCLASNGLIHDEMLAIVREFHARRP
ncbi:MAG: inositol monophosphatase family protein [Acidobacteriota bacterium]